MSINNYLKPIGDRLKKVRLDLKLNQQELANKLNDFCATNDITFSVKREKKENVLITFTQVDISNIENNNSIIKEKIYVVLSYFNKTHFVNLNFIFNDIPTNTMYNHEKLLT